MAAGGASRLFRFLRGVDVSASSARRATGRGNDRVIHEIDREEPEVVRAILRHTEATRDHMTPEIQLFLLTPNCTLYHEPSRSVLDRDEVARNVFSDPFWAIYWPGGQALARFLLDEGENLFSSSRKGMNVLDVGSGCGAAAIAAKLAGAKRVVANDIDKGLRDV